MYTWRSTRTTKDFRELDNTRELTSYAIQSQYSASEKILAVCAGFQKRIDPHFDVDLFYKKMFDIYTAEGVGLDNWGVILQMPRTIPGPFLGPCFGFDPSGCHPFYHQDGSELTYPPCGYDYAGDDCPEVVCFHSGKMGGTTGSGGNIPETNPRAVFTADTWPQVVRAVVTGTVTTTGWLNLYFAKSDTAGNGLKTIATIAASAGTLAPPDNPSGATWNAGSLYGEVTLPPFDPAYPALNFTYRTDLGFTLAAGAAMDVYGCIPAPDSDVIHNYPFVPDSSATDPDAFLITLDDEHYRMVLLYKALANISASDAATQNKLLSVLIDSGVGDMPNVGYVLQVDTMVIRWVFEDFLDSMQLAIFKAVGTLARGAGVGWELYAIDPRMVFGFDGSQMQPFNQAVFVPDYAMITPSLS